MNGVHVMIKFYFIRKTKSGQPYRKIHTAIVSSYEGSNIEIMDVIHHSSMMSACDYPPFIMEFYPKTSKTKRFI